MGSFVFRWPHDANEVFVTGTFDDWGKTVKLDKKADGFEKEVQLPTADEKIQYKFVVDGTWITDNNAREENDGHNNINNVLLPEDIKKATSENLTNLHPTAAIMSGVTPDSTTAALAADVPKETDKKAENDVQAAILSSAAPESTSADLAKNVPLEQNGNLPGTFPETPSREPEQFSVNPIPASNGIGNPIKLNAGENVPHSTNTVESTARTDKEGYEQDASALIAPAVDPTVGQNSEASAFAVPAVSSSMIPESSLPMMGSQPETTDPGVAIQSAAPTSTTAALAAAVPLESQKQTNGEAPVSEVPEVVKNSIAEAHEPPEAAASHEAVEEKKEVEQELQKKVNPNESVGEPAPTVTATTTETAPAATGLSATTAIPDSTDLSPNSSPPSGTTGPTVTTGVAAAKTAEVSAPENQTKPAESAPSSAPQAPASQPENSNNATETKEIPKEKKKKNRASGFFHKLKEKFK